MRSRCRARRRTYANPFIGDLHVADVGKRQILAVLEPIWNTKTETASRLRGRIERILNFATVNEWRAGPNPAAWSGNLKEILASPKKLKNVRHHPALPYVEIPAFMAELRNRDGQSARALEFTILTAGRTGETIGATWDEIDLAEKIWTIPASRMKAKRILPIILEAILQEFLGRSRKNAKKNH